MTVPHKGPLTRLTVNLVPRADKALTLATELTQDSRTDVVNRAIQLYAYVEHVMSRGGEFLVREDGKTSKILLSYPDPRVSQQEDPA
jgi:hypothetical protein